LKRLFLAAIIACTRGQITGVDNERAAILPLTEDPTAPACARAYTPTTSDIAKLEAQLPITLSSLPPDPRNPPLASRAPSYWRQYIGYECAGEHWIYANFFCREPDKRFYEQGYWRRNLYSVNDGGDCYFNLEYSPTLGVVRHLLINGEA